MKSTSRGFTDLRHAVAPTSAIARPTLDSLRSVRAYRGDREEFRRAAALRRFPRPTLRVPPATRSTAARSRARRRRPGNASAGSSGHVDLLLGRRQDVADQQAVQLAVGQMIGELEHDPLVVQLVNRLPQQVVQLDVCERFGVRQPQLGLEPLADRQHRGAFPGQDGREVLVLRRGTEHARIDDIHGLVEKRFQLVAQPSVEHQLVDIVGSRTRVFRHRLHTCSVARRKRRSGQGASGSFKPRLYQQSRHPARACRAKPKPFPRRSAKWSRHDRYDRQSGS